VPSLRRKGETKRKRAITGARELLPSKMLLAALILLASLPLLHAKTQGAAQVDLSAVKSALALAQKGRCQEALPILKKATGHLADKQLKYQVVMATAQCAMSLGRREDVVTALLLLNREYPRDPQVLYASAHFYSELASWASRELAATAPDSPQAEKLEAEAFESQGDWEKATAQYNRILQQNPREPGIHYRLGRILLAESPPQPAEADKEFERELKVDPSNASAEFMLGETARQAGRWDEAITHFSRAAKLDEGFAEAYLALGMSLNSAGKFAEAISALERYVKLAPGDPAGHYQLATAYARTGRRTEAERELALQREAAAKNPQAEQQ